MAYDISLYTSNSIASTSTAYVRCPNCSLLWPLGTPKCGYCHRALNVETAPEKAEPKKRQRFKPDVLAMVDRALSRRAK